MSQIRVLDNNLIDKIAAGEVIERPASVVKEIVENSIDAGATSISIEIKDGGKSFIKVVDNGCGIKKEFIETAFLRHATSKIQNFDDLEDVLTLGFRGEALSSISSVSKVELTTRTKDDDFGTKIEIHGGKVVSKEQIASNVGTVFLVKNIFFNTPARRKFLKNVQTESTYISSIINKFVLAHPNISFKYKNNGVDMIQTSGKNDLLESIFYVYGKDMHRKMLEVNSFKNGFTLKGMIGLPEISRGNRNHQNFFINRRYVKSNVVQRTIEQAYEGKITIGKFPVFVLNLTVPKSTIDVNVHPTKMEVRFYDEDFIYNFIKDSVYDVLKTTVLIPNIQLSKHVKIDETLHRQNIKDTTEKLETRVLDADEKKRLETILLNEYKNEPEISINARNNLQNSNSRYINKIDTDRHIDESTYTTKSNSIRNFMVGELSSKPFPRNSLKYENIEYKDDIYHKERIDRDNHYKPFETKNETNKDIKQETKTSIFSEFRIVGQIFNTYWIIEKCERIYLIDQHSAHERYIYENMLKKFKQDKIESQTLLVPVHIDFTEEDMYIVNKEKKLLESFGFVIEILGEKSCLVKAVPYIFKNPVSANLLVDIVDALHNMKIESIYETGIEKIIRMSCRSAVKANDKLSDLEVYELIDNILKIDNSFTCPHGRPTVIEISKYEIEKMFKRVQN